ncbi:MAG: tRNA pseudouridine(38-40) synthase TruA [Solirubrobacterales bacterium]|nr:tRNA pseudouridine(38-40) synthase TruA [Solirubrobacterales bacterium]
MAAYRFEIGYDGRDFAGWAAQPGRRTVQGELEAALEKILQRPARLTVAGRTDAGVHALAQVASVELDREPPSDLAWRLNGLLGPDVGVRSFEPAPEGFDARRWARSRTYLYRVLTGPVPDPFEAGRALWVPRPLDEPAMFECADSLAGEHDFTAFTPTDTKHSRFRRNVLASSWEREGERLLAFRITADAYLRSMVRVLVGSMLEAGEGRRDADGFRALLEGAPRSAAGRTAPAHGLYLEAIELGDGPAFDRTATSSAAHGPQSEVSEGDSPA